LFVGSQDTDQGSSYIRPLAKLVFYISL
jgi:hypothetical protein